MCGSSSAPQRGQGIPCGGSGALSAYAEPQPGQVICIAYLPHCAREYDFKTRLGNQRRVRDVIR
jgi:hypothetical protein